jgi:hypothetical protein
LLWQANRVRVLSSSKALVQDLLLAKGEALVSADIAGKDCARGFLPPK